MKTYSLYLRKLSALTGGVLLAISSQAPAATYYWDVDGTVSGFSTVVGAWNGTNSFWNSDATGGNAGSTIAVTTSADDLVIAQATTNTGSITLTGALNASSISFDANVGPTTTITGGTSLTIGGTGTYSGIRQLSTGANTISTALILNSAVSNFEFSNSNTGLLTIGAVTGAATSGTQTITVGASSTGGITLGGVIGNGAGGGRVGLTINSSGAGITTLSGANSFTGQLTVARGTLSIASINNVNANGTLGNNNISLPVILGSSGGNTGTLQYTAGSGTSDKGFALATGGTGAFDVTTALTLTGPITGSGNLSKVGAGVLTLDPSLVNGNNQGVGVLNQFTGTTTISNGKIKLTSYNVAGAAYTVGAMFGLHKSVYDTTGSTGAIGLDVTPTGAATISAPVLGGLAGSVNLATAITSYTTVTTLYLNPQSGVSASYGGQITNGSGAMTLTKMGPGTQTLTGTSNYTGATTVIAGTLALSGVNGSILNSASYTVRGGTLLLDNSGGTFISRLADATALSLGSLTLSSYNGAGANTETVGTTTFAVGGKVTINNGSTVGDQTTLAMGAVTRSAAAAIDFVGTNGTLGGGANSPNVTSTSWSAMTNNILPWATVNGTTWAATSGTNIVAYSGAFVDPTSAASAATSNAQLIGTGIMASAKSFNSLNIISNGAGQSLNLSASTGNLTLTSGAILKSGTEAYTISSSGSPTLGNITAGTELIAHVDGGALTISAPLNTAIVGIAKGGTGTLILSGTRATTFSGPIGIGGGTLEFQGLSTSSSGGFTGSGNLIINLNPGQVFTSTGAITSNFSGSVLVKGGTLNTGAFSSGGLGIAPFAPGVLYSTGGLNNIELNGGNIAWSYTFGRYLGTGPDQIQLTGGVSGFSVVGNSGGNFSLNGNNTTEIVWGAANEAGNAFATGFFNPSTLVLNDSATAGAVLTFASPLDLNASTRFIATNSFAFGATISGIIRNSSGTAGLTKTGVGTLTLSGVNTYNGATTISAGTLNANSTSALGDGSATNTLVFNGGTLQAGAAFTSVATRGVTMTATGIIDTNTFALGIAGNITGAGGLTKNGFGALTLSGTNSYGGVTTVNAGTLAITKQAALYNTTPASWTAANINIKGGATLALNVDATGGFTTGNLSTLLSNIFVANTAAEGLQGGSILALDTTNAGGTFTHSGAITDSTGAYGGMISLTKLGVGTLLLDQANTYTGTTLISAGTLNFGSSANQTLSGLIGGAGALTKSGAGTLTLSAANLFSGNTIVSGGILSLTNSRALQNSVLDTTASIAGDATNGLRTTQTTLTLGGLSGNKNFASIGGVFTTTTGGYGSVTNLTLNPQSGSSFTYGGVIADGATGMTLTKTGAGTQILSGANIYTGATIINAGTLQVGNSTSGNLLNTGTFSALTFGGTSTFNVQEAAGMSQSMGLLTLSAGDGTVTSTWNNGAGSGNTAVTFASLAARSAGATVNFTLAGTGSTAANNRIALTSTTNAPLTTTSNDAGMFFGGSGYARYNATTNTFGAVVYGTDTNANAALTGAQTTLGTIGSAIDATYNGLAAATANTTAVAQNAVTVLNVLNGAAFQVGQAITGTNITANTYIVSIAGNALTLNQVTGNIAASTVLTPYNLVSAQTTDSLNTLSLNGLGASLALASSQTLSVNGVLRSGNNLGVTGVISGGTGIQAATTNGDLVIRTDLANDTLNISSNILANGTNALTKSGAGTLILRSTASTYTGGVFINAGTLTYTNDGSLGASGSRNITFGGAATLTGYDGSSLGQLTVGSGAVGTISGANVTFATTTGSGMLVYSTGAVKTLNIGDASGFTGTLQARLTGNAGYNATTSLQFSRIADTVGSALQFVGGQSDGGQSMTIALAGNSGAQVFNNRTIEILPHVASNWGVRNNIIANNNTTLEHTWIINTNLVHTSSQDRTFGLSGTHGGNNAFNGVISNGSAGGTINLAKSGTGRWIVSAANTYSGATTVSAGTLGFASGALGSVGSINASGGTLLWLTGNTQDISSRLVMTAATTSTFNTWGNNVTFASAIGSSSTGALTKNGLGTLTLGGTNTYTGATTLNAGTLSLNYATNNTTKLADTTGILALNGGTLELSGGSHTEVVTSTTLNTGGTFITRPSGTSTLSMGAITFTAGAIDFSADSIATTSTGVTNGILSQRATVAGANFAMKSGSNIVAYDYVTNGGTGYAGGVMTANFNYALVDGTSITTSRGAATNTLKITTTTASSTAISTGATLTLGSMLFAGANDYAISTTGTGRIAATLLHNYGSGVLTLGSLGVDLTQYGTGKTILNTAALGDYGMNIHGGTVEISSNLQIGTNATVKAITLNNGTLLASETLALNNGGLNSRTITLGAGGGTLAAASTKTLTVSGVISGADNQLSIGNATSTGTVTLTGTNTYTGLTRVNNGTLVVNGNISTSSLTTVASGATIGGFGTVGALTVASGGFINPGDSLGILTVSGNYAQAGLYTAGITGITAGTEHDRIAVTGTVDITGGSLTAAFSAGSYAANNLIFLLLNDGVDAITGTYAGFAQGATVTNYGGFDWQISYVANSGTSNFLTGNDIALMAVNPIPEPRAALLGCLGVLLLLRRRR